MMGVWVCVCLWGVGVVLKEFKWVFKYLYCVPNNMEKTPSNWGGPVAWWCLAACNEVILQTEMKENAHFV